MVVANPESEKKGLREILPQGAIHYGPLILNASDEISDVVKDFLSSDDCVQHV